MKSIVSDIVVNDSSGRNVMTKAIRYSSVVARHCYGCTTSTVNVIGSVSPTTSKTITQYLPS